jgi:hypothetical protein
LKSLAGLHEGQEIIVVGNGPSLNNVGAIFLNSRPTIALNWLPYHRKDFAPTYWTCQDDICQRASLYLPDSTIRLMPQWLVEWKKFPAERILAIQRWTTSILFGSELALRMKASKILWVGFDCSYRDAPYQNRGQGHTSQPHFYGLRMDAIKHEKWNVEAGEFHRLAGELGVEVLNLSDPTFCDTVPRAHVGHLSYAKGI